MSRKPETETKDENSHIFLACTFLLYRFVMADIELAITVEMRVVHVRSAYAHIVLIILFGVHQQRRLPNAKAPALSFGIFFFF